MAQFFYNLTVGRALVIGLALGAAYYFFMYDDGSVLQKQIQVARQQIAQDQNKIASINKAIEDAKTFVKVKAALGAEMQTVLKAIPSELTSLEFMQTLSNQAKTLGLQINSIAPNESFRSSSDRGKGDAAFFKPIVVSVQLIGTYNQVMEFMSALTALDKIVTVESLDMSAQQQGGLDQKSSVPVLNFNASLAAYRFLSDTKGGEK